MLKTIENEYSENAIEYLISNFIGLQNISLQIQEG